MPHIDTDPGRLTGYTDRSNDCGNSNASSVSYAGNGNDGSDDGDDGGDGSNDRGNGSSDDSDEDDDSSNGDASSDGGSDQSAKYCSLYYANHKNTILNIIIKRR